MRTIYQKLISKLNKKTEYNVDIFFIKITFKIEKYKVHPLFITVYIKIVPRVPPKTIHSFRR